MNQFFRQILIPGMVLSFLAALGLGYFQGIHWAAGTLIGFGWMFLNVYFLFNLIEMAFKAKPEDKNKIFLITLIKFPVLYLAGFFILKTRAFAVYAVLIGLTIFMTVFSIGWLRYNLGKKLVGKTSL